MRLGIFRPWLYALRDRGHQGHHREGYDMDPSSPLGTTRLCGIAPPSRRVSRRTFSGPPTLIGHIGKYAVEKGGPVGGFGGDAISRPPVHGSSAVGDQPRALRPAEGSLGCSRVLATREKEGLVQPRAFRVFLSTPRPGVGIPTTRRRYSMGTCNLDRGEIPARGGTESRDEEGLDKCPDGVWI